MFQLRQAYLASISIFLLSMLSFSGAAQSLLPQEDGSRTKFTTTIEMPKGYVSGICVIMLEGDVLKGSIFNEFGITAQPKDAVASLNETVTFTVAAKGTGLSYQWQVYENTRRHILYQFLPLSNAETEDQENDSQDNEIAQ